jgi:hypothetical protein
MKYLHISDFSSWHIGKRKGEVHPITSHKGQEGEQKYNSTLFNLSARWGWVINALPLGKRSSTHCTGGWTGWVQKTLPPPEFDPWTIQPVASHYTTYAVSAPSWYLVERKLSDSRTETVPDTRLDQ